MPVRLNITMDEDVYRRLKRELPPKKISAFIEDAVRMRLYPDRASLDAAYQAARKEKWRAELSSEWAVTETEGWPESAPQMRRIPQSESQKALMRGPRRGDVYFALLDSTVGTEIRKTRPAVVVSNDSCNAYGARVVVLPVTSHVETGYPGEARIRLKGVPARVLGDQIRSIDKSRLRSRIAVLSREELLDVEAAIRITLGLGPT